MFKSLANEDDIFSSVMANVSTMEMLPVVARGLPLLVMATMPTLSAIRWQYDIVLPRKTSRATV